MADVWHRSPRPTLGCFLSPRHWKGKTMLAKGKASNVFSASQREPVPHNPEGRPRCEATCRAASQAARKGVK